jgi:hypothetical protein
VKLGRRASLWITDVLDRYLPPSVRDSRLFGNLARRMYDGLAIDIVDLKDKAFYLSRAEFASFYQSLHSRFDQGVTDLTPASFDAVLAAVRGKSVLVAVSAGRRGTHPNVRWCDGNIEELPFRDRAFDTVISTHTLEHVQHLGLALGELRRVARRRIVVVVPHQRPYRTTFNPHIHFFPYKFSLLAWTGTDRPHTLDLVGGDWLYVEDVIPEVARRSP